MPGLARFPAATLKSPPAAADLDRVTPGRTSPRRGILLRHLGMIRPVLATLAPGVMFGFGLALLVDRTGLPTRIWAGHELLQTGALAVLTSLVTVLGIGRGGAPARGAPRDPAGVLSAGSCTRPSAVAAGFPARCMTCICRSAWRLRASLDSGQRTDRRSRGGAHLPLDRGRVRVTWSWSWTPTGVVTFVSESVTKILGWPVPEVQRAPARRAGARRRPGRVPGARRPATGPVAPAGGLGSAAAATARLRRRLARARTGRVACSPAAARVRRADRSRRHRPGGHRARTGAPGHARRADRAAEPQGAAAAGRAGGGQGHRAEPGRP